LPASRHSGGTATDIRYRDGYRGHAEVCGCAGVRPEAEGCERMFANKARFRIVLTAGREPQLPLHNTRRK
jgi:hypothetical protein